MSGVCPVVALLSTVISLHCIDVAASACTILKTHWDFTRLRHENLPGRLCGDAQLRDGRLLVDAGSSFVSDELINAADSNSFTLEVDRRMFIFTSELQWHRFGPSWKGATGRLEGYHR